jgi:TolB-like protein
MNIKISLKQKLEHQLMCQISKILILSLIFIVFLAGCSKRYSDYPVYNPFSWYDEELTGVGRFKTSFLIDQVDEYYRGTNPGPIAIATFVNVDDLYSTSTFGRMVSEQVMSELSMRGYDVIELRHSDALQFLASDGEFALSRDVGMVRKQRDLGGIVVGTYTVSPVRVYVNARLIDPSSSTVVSAGSVEMSKTKEIARMLRGGAFPATLERIPVKHLGQNTYPLAWNVPNQQAMQWDQEERNNLANSMQPVIKADLPPIAALPNNAAPVVAEKKEPIVVDSK